MNLFDAETADLVIQGAQELLILPRPTGYKNPYRKLYMKNAKQQEAFEEYKKVTAENEARKKSEAKSKPKKTGPKLTARSDL